VPAHKLVLGIPTYARGWTGVPSTDNGLYQTSYGPAPFPPADYLQTPGVITYLTLTGLTGFARHFDYRRIAVWLYDPNTQTFWSYDDPVTVWLKTAYVRTRTGGGLGGALLRPDQKFPPPKTSARPMPENRISARIRSVYTTALEVRFPTDNAIFHRYVRRFQLQHSRHSEFSRTSFERSRRKSSRRQSLVYRFCLLVTPIRSHQHLIGFLPKIVFLNHGERESELRQFVSRLVRPHPLIEFADFKKLFGR
jgi:Glycosyl hydrolases family 18